MKLRPDFIAGPYGTLTLRNYFFAASLTIMKHPWPFSCTLGGGTVFENSDSGLENRKNCRTMNWFRVIVSLNFIEEPAGPSEPKTMYSLD